MNEGLIISSITKSVFILANSIYPNETPRFEASHLDLLCLYIFPFLMHSACSTGAYFEFESSYAPVSEYDQGMLNSHTEDPPKAARGRDS